MLQPFISFVIEENYEILHDRIPVETFLKSMFIPSAVIYVRVSSETAHSRYVNRENKSGRIKSLNNLIRRFRVGYEICEKFCEMYSSLGYPIHILNAENKINSRELEDCASNILKKGNI